MKHILIYKLSLFSIIFLLIGCEKNVTIAPPPYDTRVSIQGIIEVDSFPIVYFNRTVPYFDKLTHTNELIIRKADLQIKSPDGTDRLKLDSLYDFLKCEHEYFYKGTRTIKSNMSYQLLINHNNQTYAASASTAIKPVGIDSVRYTKAFNDVYGEHEGVIIYFKDVPNTNNYYRYEMKRPIDTTMKHASSKILSPCIGKKTVTVLEIGRSVYTDENNDAQPIKIVVEPGYSHKKGIATKVRIQTIDKNIYSFYDQLDRQKLAQYNPFVEPVFLKAGQFGSTGVGFFGAIIRSKPIDFEFPE